MIGQVIKIGGKSLGVTIRRKVVEQKGLKEGDFVIIQDITKVQELTEKDKELLEE